MLTTFIRHQSDLDDEIADDFRRHVDAWVAVAGEFLPIEEILDEIRREGEE